MSTNQQYSLRWNNHQPNFISMFTSLLSTKTLVDVTLAAEGKQMCAHKVVLSACSTYFQSLFVENPSTHPIVILKDVSFADLRIMVDFMYYGEVNVTEAQLPKVLETARMLKIKGLTEMPENTSLTRFQGSDRVSAVGEYHTPDSESHLVSSSPPSSPHSPPLPGITAHKRKRRRKLSMESSGLNRTHDVSQELKNDEAGPSLDMVQSETVTLSSLPQQKHTRDADDRQLCVNTPQTQPGHNLNMETMHLDQQHPGMSQGELEGYKLRRTRLFRRQSRVAPEDREMTKQVSEPGPATVCRNFQRHQSYPQYAPKNWRSVATETDDAAQAGQSSAHRASHTPIVRAGPPLSCNFCWNTVDDNGRILRRKTQYHCPECRTNLCIVPCFHEYHDSSDVTEAIGARSAPFLL